MLSRFAGVSAAGACRACLSKVEGRNPERSEGSPLTKGNSHQDLSRWLLFMSATTYSPTHFRAQYNRPCVA